MNSFLLERANIKAVVPSDGDTAITGSRVALSTGQRVAIVVNMGDSTGAVADFTLKQHNAASSGTTKDLSIANPYFKKAGAATSFTKVEPTVAAANYVLTSDFAAQEGVVVFEVLQEDLDVNNSFGWVSIDVADTTAAKLISILYIVLDPESQPAYSTAL